MASRRLTGWLVLGVMAAAMPAQSLRAEDSAVDLRFNAGGQGASDDVYDAALLLHGKGFLIGGHFTSYNGRERWRLARLHPDGTLDESLDPRDSTGSAPVSRVAALPDGKSLIAGPFNKYDGQRRHLLARLGADGAIDSGFDPNQALGAEGTVNALAVLSEGKAFVGGRFESPAGGRRMRALVRLLADGALDDGFSAAIVLADATDKINALAVLPGGKLLVAGQFHSGAGSGGHGIARLEADGRIDPGFHPPADVGPVKALAVQADGKILIAAAPADDRPSRRLLARLNADGSPDASFNPGEASGEGDGAGSVEALAVQPDDKLLVGGSFHHFGGARRNGLARLNADGSLDRSFDPGTGVGVLAFDDPDETPESTVRAILLLPGGGLLIAGRFDLYNGASCRNVARILNGAPSPVPSLATIKRNNFVTKRLAFRR